MMFDMRRELLSVVDDHLFTKQTSVLLLEELQSALLAA